MYTVVDQWNRPIKTFEEREDAQAYIAQREALYRDKPSIGPRFYIKEDT